MEFNIQDEDVGHLDPSSVPYAETVQIDVIPTAEPVIRILTWKDQLNNFLQKTGIPLDSEFINNMTNFSFEKKWDIVSPELYVSTSNGSFVLKYTHEGIQVQLDAEYTFIQMGWGKHHQTNKININGSFEDDAAIAWDHFQCDNCQLNDHSLWFIKVLSEIYGYKWEQLMNQS